MWPAAALALFIMLPGAPAPRLPAAAPSLYVTHNQGLAITIPRGLTYCPLPDDWVGSGHGVDLYLVPPTSCGEAGYQSSDRFAAPQTPAIEIYYDIDTYDFVDGTPCRRRVRGVRLFGNPVRACLGRDGRWITVEASAHYMIDGERHDLILTLKTTRARYASDLALFQGFAPDVRACRPEWAGGRLPACPSTQWF